MIVTRFCVECQNDMSIPPHSDNLYDLPKECPSFEMRVAMLTSKVRWLWSQTMPTLA